MQYIAFLGIHLLLISGLFWKITSLILEPVSIFCSVVLWYSHLENLESNLNSWLYFVCAEFSSFPASALPCPVFCLNIPSNEEKNPNFSLLWWPLKKLFTNKSPSSCVPPLPLNLLKEVTSITKWSFLFFPTIILPPAFLLYCIVWPVVLICLFCLFFTVLAQSLTLLALPCCALYLSVLYLLIIWIALPGSWPYFLHYRFKFFLPSIFSLISLLCTACSFVAIIKVLLQSFFHKPLMICHHLFMSCSCCSSSFTSGFASLVALSNESSSVGIYSSFHVGIWSWSA